MQQWYMYKNVRHFHLIKNKHLIDNFKLYKKFTELSITNKCFSSLYRYFSSLFNTNFFILTLSAARITTFSASKILNQSTNLFSSSCRSIRLAQHIASIIIEATRLFLLAYLWSRIIILLLKLSSIVLIYEIHTDIDAVCLFWFRSNKANKMTKPRFFFCK